MALVHFACKYRRFLCCLFSITPSELRTFISNSPLCTQLYGPPNPAVLCISRRFRRYLSATATSSTASFPPQLRSFVITGGFLKMSQPWHNSKPNSCRTPRLSQPIPFPAISPTHLRPPPPPPPPPPDTYSDTSPARYQYCWTPYMDW
jgi:hypothetical protein